MSASVSAVLNVFRRGANFRNQIQSIEEQSYPVGEILVWENGQDSVSTIDIKNLVKARSNSNLGVWARFAFALNAKSDFVWIIDDDSIPGSHWLGNALDTFAIHPGVIGSRGLKFRSRNAYSIYEEFGPNKPNLEAVPVDIVGHNWIFPRDWLAYFWMELPNRYQSEIAGEDIHLSFAIQKHLKLGTFVPPHPPGDKRKWGELSELSEFDGRDAAGISSDIESLKKFEKAFSHYTKLGFRVLEETKQEASSLNQWKWGLIAKLVGSQPVLAHRLAKFLKVKKRFRKK